VRLLEYDLGKRQVARLLRTEQALAGHGRSASGPEDLGALLRTLRHLEPRLSPPAPS
jgi:hypothetical protein